jgi:hypothetical protein
MHTTGTTVVQHKRTRVYRYEMGIVHEAGEVYFFRILGVLVFLGLVCWVRGHPMPPNKKITEEQELLEHPHPSR